MAEIKRERSNWDQEHYDEQCAAWAGKLSETWEQLLHLEIAQPLFDRSTSKATRRC